MLSKSLAIRVFVETYWGFRNSRPRRLSVTRRGGLLRRRALRARLRRRPRPTAPALPRVAAARSERVMRRRQLEPSPEPPFLDSVWSRARGARRFRIAPDESR